MRELDGRPTAWRVLRVRHSSRTRGGENNGVPAKRARARRLREGDEDAESVGTMSGDNGGEPADEPPDDEEGSLSHMTSAAPPRREPRLEGRHDARVRLAAASRATMIALVVFVSGSTCGAVVQPPEHRRRTTTGPTTAPTLRRPIRRRRRGREKGARRLKRLVHATNAQGAAVSRRRIPRASDSANAWSWRTTSALRAHESGNRPRIRTPTWNQGTSR